MECLVIRLFVVMAASEKIHCQLKSNGMYTNYDHLSLTVLIDKDFKSAKPIVIIS